jgi:hypothetical protein
MIYTHVVNQGGEAFEARWTSSAQGWTAGDFAISRRPQKYLRYRERPILSVPSHEIDDK